MADFPSNTSRIAVWKKNKAVLWHYPSPQKKYNTPVFLVYSLVNQAFILDLGPGASMIEGFTEQGYDVYLLDFGIPGYEDKYLTLDHYIIDYIQTGVQRALMHSGTEAITLTGYCLGGTLAVIYAAVAKEPIKNLILFAAPVDFSQSRDMNNWIRALKQGEINVNELIDEYGVIPAKVMEYALKMVTSPVSFTPQLAKLARADDKKYLEKWRRFDTWVKGHVPFAGAALKQLINDLVKDNKLIKNNLKIRGQRVNLRKIKANLLVVSTEGDQLIPEELIKPLMAKVTSVDKTYKRVKGGHVTLAIRGGIPDFLSEWLRDHS
ncbi:alpha/beta fold hydrolase [Mesobacillus harenae]|uniref:alpha/beta fold hydrolase n=1 Tax=Mesobacillus harenae TaxID=2213203 RepID=UPI001580DBCC